MGKFVVQVQGKYALWSEIVDAPITPFVDSLERLAEVSPASVLVPWLNGAKLYGWGDIAYNRAGEHETCLPTPEAMLAAYPDEPDPPPAEEAPEPAKRLYDALRAAEMIPPSWGDWDYLPTVSPTLQAKVRRCASLLWPEPERGVAQGEGPTAVEHEHSWDCAACRHDSIVLYCRTCPVIRKERL